MLSSSCQGSDAVLLASNWTMTNSSFRLWRSSSPTSLAVAETGNFTSTSVIVGGCKKTNGIFVLGAAAVVSNLETKWV